ncbi:ABC transporter ATP binding protein - unknown substrate [Streptococcus pneumoniae]|nr:ABC transporter ATP binding protein - unknown substrate [Streptococcus pneumoniae]
MEFFDKFHALCFWIFSTNNCHYSSLYD